MIELNKIYEDGFIDENQYKSIQSFESGKLFSVHWELRTILYLGVLLLISGLGILVYLNIDTIGHQAILAAIGLTCLGCYYYAYKHRLPYQNEQVVHASPFFDYVVLFGCLLFATLIGYFQFQYDSFGHHYGLLVFIPTALSFYTAYRFDHKGILSIAISGLASSFGLSVTPSQLIYNSDFSEMSLIVTAIIFGIALVLWAWFADIKNIKKHFGFTYNHFALHVLCVAILSALFDKDLKLISFLLLGVFCFYFIRYTLIQKSYLILLFTVLYAYIGFTYFVFFLLGLLGSMNEIIFFFGMMYVIASAIGVIFFLINLKKIVNIKR